MATQTIPPPGYIYGATPPNQGDPALTTGEYGTNGGNVPVGPTGMPQYNTDPNIGVTNILAQNNAQTIAGGQQINSEAQGQLGYYSPLQEKATNQENTALNQLDQTPGYTPTEAGQINVNYGADNTSQAALGQEFLTPGEQSAIAGDPNAPVQTMSAGTAAEGAQLNAFGANLGGNVSALDTGVGGSEAALESGVGGANTNLENWVTAPVDNPGLAFDPNQTEQQITPAQEQEMKTAAGTRIGNQYRTAEDTLNRNAAAAGNTSPLALAAANARLQTQEASDQGNAETTADIAARQAQEQQAAQIEAARYGETANTAALQEQAATTAGLADVNSSEMVGQSGVNAAETVGQAGIGAAENYGAAALNESATAANQNYGAAATAEQEAAARAATLGTNRQAAQANVNNTQYAQDTNSQQLTSAGAQTVGNARIAGEGAYRAGVAQQQGLAQEGGQTAISEQQGAYGTETQGLNTSAGNRVNEEVGNLSNTPTKQASQVISSILGEGGIITKPTKAIVGEKGPEMIVPLGGGYRSRDRKAA